MLNYPELPRELASDLPNRPVENPHRIFYM